MADNNIGGFPNLFNKKSKDIRDTATYDSNHISDDSDSSSDRIISIPTRDIYYKTDHPNIGIALIFNHTDIVGQEPRDGTDEDKQRIKTALQLFGFEVRIYDDQTVAEINQILMKAGKEDHSRNDCLMVVVMSHGTPAKVWAKDKFYPVQHLWKPFLGKNCKTLINKPKLFFIQTCRGRKLEPPVQYKDSFKSGNDVHDAPRSVTYSIPNTAMDSDIDVHDAPRSVTYSIPNTADLLIMYSTFAGCCSWRNEDNGSWFIQSLSHVLEEAAKSEDDSELISLLTIVNRKVAYEYQSYAPYEKCDKMKEMPNFVSTLTKTFKFKPKKIIQKDERSDQMEEIPNFLSTLTETFKFKPKKIIHN